MHHETISLGRTCWRGGDPRMWCLPLVRPPEPELRWPVEPPSAWRFADRAGRL